MVSKVSAAALALLLMFGVGAANAINFMSTGNPLDANVGTVITAFPTSETISYQDINNNQKATQDASMSGGVNINVTVIAEYGLSFAQMQDQSANVGVQMNNTSGATNKGNSVDTYTLTFVASYGATQGTGQHWYVQIRNATNESVVTTLTTSGASSGPVVRVVAEDADYTFHIVVSGEAGALGFVTIVSSAAAAGVPAGQYLGTNGLTYGGFTASWESSNYFISGINMTLTRTATTDAPLLGGYAGNVRDVVPGTVISYKLSYATVNGSNTSAEMVAIIDKVPANANLAHFNSTGAMSYETITMPYGTGAGWAVFYSTQANPVRNYGDTTTWTFVGTPGAGAAPSYPGGNRMYQYTTDPVPFTATWVKFEKMYVASNESGTLTWGVTVR